MATAFFLALEYKTGSIVIEALGGCVGGGGGEERCGIGGGDVST